jgi:hypothetical protein
MKTMKKKGIGVRSLVCNTWGKKRFVVAMGWGLE